jgi:Protein of unknown function (DUF732)
MFAHTRFATFAGTALVAGALGLAAVATAGTAGALSSTDDSFLTEITSEGISFDTAKDAVSDAHYVCSALDDGADPVDLGQEILDNTDLTTHQAAVFVVASVSTYCPEYAGYFE